MKTLFLLDNKETYYFLFESKDVMIEELVQLFICVIDAQLLKGVDSKVLKPKNVQNSQKPAREEQQ